MRVTVTRTHDFEGCYYGCPFLYGGGVMANSYCDLSKGRRIVGVTSKSNEIPPGKKKPDWCELKDGGIYVVDNNPNDKFRIEDIVKFSEEKND